MHRERVASPRSALQFCRFLASPGIRHLLQKQGYRPEVIPRSSAHEVLFRHNGEDAHRLRDAWSSGLEGIVSDRAYTRLRLPSTGVRHKGANWVIERVCLTHANPSRWNTATYVLQGIEEHLTSDGVYNVRVTHEALAPASVEWEIFYNL